MTRIKVKGCSYYNHGLQCNIIIVGSITNSVICQSMQPPSPVSCSPYPSGFHPKLCKVYTNFIRLSLLIVLFVIIATLKTVGLSFILAKCLPQPKQLKRFDYISSNIVNYIQ